MPIDIGNFTSSMRVFFKIIVESVLIAINELVTNKLRSFLSLFGITIGILCIISVFTAVDSLERNIRSSIEKLGDDVIYIQRWPWNFGDENYEWWKYFKRPVSDRQELKAIQKKVQSASSASLVVRVEDQMVKHRDLSMEDIETVGVTFRYERIKRFIFQEGRFFSMLEANSGSNVAILGANIADQLFPRKKQIVGRYIQYKGRDVRVIGVLEEEGDDILGFSADNQVYLPYNFINRFFKFSRRGEEPFLAVKARDGLTLESLKSELTGVMRAQRRLKPSRENNFALNQISILSKNLNSIFGMINIAGWVIGLFAILVGGFGIANIMFVSVKERTSLIGIKKALGAKNYFIMFEFLTESVILCLTGGLIGMLLVYLLTIIAENIVDFNFVLTLYNFLLGVGLSVGIGLVSGFLPALNAARLDPVEAIRS